MLRLSSFARPRVASIVAVLALAGLAASCSSSASLAYDPKQASELSHKALLTAEKLPGSGWTVTSTDDFTDDENLADSANTAACKAVDAKMSALTKLVEKDRAARATTTFDGKPGKNEVIPASVEETVAIFNNTSTPEEALKSYREIAGSADFSQCTSDIVKASVSAAGVEVKLVSAKPSHDAPENGFATAFEIDVTAMGSISANIRFEVYVWRHGNAGVTLELDGPAARLDSAFVGGTIDAATAALKAAESR